MKKGTDPGRLQVVRWDKGDHEDKMLYLRSTFESRGYNCSTYHYPPGTVFPDHKHAVDKIDAVLSGRFKITIDGESVILAAGDYIHVPAGTIHRAEVVSDVDVVSIDATK